MKIQKYKEINMYLDLGVLGEEVEFLVDFEYYPGWAGSLTEPPEEATIEITSATCWMDGTQVDLIGCEGVGDALEPKCWEHLEEG
jgi:hypothetical protein